MSLHHNNPRDFMFGRDTVEPSAKGAAGCTRKKNCPSDTAHKEHCAGLAVQLIGIKERRKAFEAQGGRR